MSRNSHREGLAPAVSRRARRMLAGSVTVYVIVYLTLSLIRHRGLVTYGFDLGIFDQGIWLLSRFHAPFVTIRGLNLFGDHTSFLLLPLVPLYWVWPSPEILLVVQTVTLGLSAVPLFWIARRLLGDEPAAATVSIAFLAQPAIGWLNLDQFHPEAVVVPLVLVALWAMVSERWRLFLVAAGLVLLVKEDMALLMIGVGIYVAVRRNRRIGIITVLGSIAYAAAALGFLRLMNGVGTVYTWRLPFGGPAGLVETAVRHPGDLVRYLLGDARPLYVLELLGPLLLLPLLAPSALAMATGPILSNLISDFGYQHQIRYHYTAAILPVVGFAAVLGLTKVRSTGWRRSVAVATLGAALVGTYLIGPLPGSREPATIPDVHSPAVQDAYRAFALIPDDAVVSAYYPFVTHLDHRVEIYEFPTPFWARSWGVLQHEHQRLPEADRVEYVLVTVPVPEASVEATLEEIRPEFETIFRTDHVELLRRRVTSG